MIEVVIARAFAPARITGFFMIFPNGSTGAGINLGRGAETEVVLESGSSPHSILVNYSDQQAIVSRRVLESYQIWLQERHIKASTVTSFPVGFGYGMSGAGSFSLSLALNQVLSAGKKYRECMQIAAEAEIFCGTGLGTVISQQYFGFMIGDTPYPSQTATQIACDEDTVVCGSLSPLETGKIIRNSKWKERINAVGKDCMLEINRFPTIKNFTQLARHFTFSTGLASEAVNRIMLEVPTASMAMLGQTVFAICKQHEARNIEREFQKYTNRTQIEQLGTRAATVL